MRILAYFLIPAILLVANSCSKNDPGNFVLVKGGAFQNKNSNLFGKNIIIKDFYIGKYELTQKEWVEVMGSNPSKFKGDSLPVDRVSWYESVEYCNKRSIKEGLKPYYTIDTLNKDPDNRSEFDSIKWTVKYNPRANGYRLPTEAEWEYAAGGGHLSKSYIYSGSNEVDEVAWYWKNSGDTILNGPWHWIALENNNNKTKKVGSKKPNELGLYDMSGNVREWCDEWYADVEVNIGLYRAQRGGGWMGSEYRCESANRDNFDANGKGPDQGFRLCRSVN